MNLNLEEHFGLVNSVITKNFKSKLFFYEYDDLFQIGCIALMKAINRYDESSGIKFSTFATTCIKNYLINFFASDKWNLGIYSERSNGKNNFPISIEHKNDEGEILNSFIPIQDSFEEEVIGEIFIDYLLSTLTEREKFIIEKYVLEGIPQVKIARTLKTSNSYVSSTYKKALVKMKRFINIEKKMSNSIGLESWTTSKAI